MQYLFETEDHDYSDYASGRVLYSLPGRPVLPVRLASEVFQRGLNHWRAGGGHGPVRLFDPCCGSAFHLAVLGFLHGAAIREMAAADIDAGVLELAGRNLGLLSLAGLDRRIADIQRILAAYGKDSHRQALESALHLRDRLAEQAHQLPARVFQADSTDPAALARGLVGMQADLVLADVPYGWHSDWQFTGTSVPPDPLFALLEALKGILAPGGVVVVICDKAQKPAHPAYQRLERIRIGRRQGVILKDKG
jgi:hypothetical protein